MEIIIFFFAVFYFFCIRYALSNCLASSKKTPKISRSLPFSSIHGALRCSCVRVLLFGVCCACCKRERSTRPFASPTFLLRETSNSLSSNPPRSETHASVRGADAFVRPVRSCVVTCSSPYPSRRGRSHLSFSPSPKLTPSLASRSTSFRSANTILNHQTGSDLRRHPTQASSSSTLHGRL